MPEVREFPENTQHIHIMGVGGTAMAALAGLLVAKGYKVTGSDGNVVYPPMSDVLAKYRYCTDGRLQQRESHQGTSGLSDRRKCCPSNL